MGAPTRFIALEEHCLTPPLKQALDQLPSPTLRLDPRNATNFDEVLLNFSDIRIAAMDAAGIDVQVLSHRPPGAQLSRPEEAISVARQSNDAMAEAINLYPSRFAGFATLPLIAPKAAGDELTRCVEEHGFKGAMIHGRVHGEFLDHPELDPILRASAELDVPLFLHPGEPNETVRAEYYSGLQVPSENAPLFEMLFSAAGWGWHVEAGTHALRLILGGILDRYPTLQIILGHWGELVPFYLARIDAVLGPPATHLKKRPAEYFMEHFYVTPSGLETIPPLMLCLEVLGADRIMYATDYPFVPTLGRSYIDHAPLSDTDKAKIAHLNAERLLRID